MANADPIVVQTARAMLAGFQAIGLDAATLARRCDIDPDELEGSAPRLPPDAITSLWDAGFGTDDSARLGLLTGAHVPFGMYEVLDYLAASCRTVGAGMRQLARYFRLVAPPIRIEIAEEPDEVRVDLLHATGFHPAFEGFTVAILVQRFRGVSGVDFAPLEVCFHHAPPADATDYEALFRCPVRFGCAHPALVLSREVWTRPLPRRDAGLRAVLEGYAARLAEEAPPQPSEIVRTVQNAVMEALRHGEPRLDNVAGRLGMSPRTRQRRLREAGVAFSSMVDELRRRLAERYLRAGRLSTAEVAYLLGYSETSAFTRAFKRWTGVPPGAFRDAIDP